jgi:hypothetical protein
MQDPDAIPFACTLDLQALGTRLAEIARLCARHLRGHRLEGRTLRLAFAPAAAEELGRLVALERACCAFLHFEVARHADAIELAIVAPAHAALDTRALLAPFLQAAAVPGDGGIANNGGSAGSDR